MRELRRAETGFNYCDDAFCVGIRDDITAM
jgi:hypothetical protein